MIHLSTLTVWTPLSYPDVAIRYGVSFEVIDQIIRYYMEKRYLPSDIPLNFVVRWNILYPFPVTRDAIYIYEQVYESSNEMKTMFGKDHKYAIAYYRVRVALSGGKRTSIKQLAKEVDITERFIRALIKVKLVKVEKDSNQLCHFSFIGPDAPTIECIKAIKRDIAHQRHGKKCCNSISGEAVSEFTHVEKESPNAPKRVRPSFSKPVDRPVVQPTKKSFLKRILSLFQ